MGKIFGVGWFQKIDGTCDNYQVLFFIFPFRNLAEKHVILRVFNICY